MLGGMSVYIEISDILQAETVVIPFCFSEYLMNFIYRLNSFKKVLKFGLLPENLHLYGYEIWPI